ncbi:hypothetical protein Y032_0086g1985 [Ancylostoma ceylanicum]|uniref:Uncharacterized protein n=1 Tax=Ancylostoma ceylanicum TaxID=53326 RepID=A0A016TPV8_9BILA|nr:hypothetical protein Y032_0086g1985 [Ancylostoma ceylanicum]
MNWLVVELASIYSESAPTRPPQRSAIQRRPRLPTLQPRLPALHVTISNLRTRFIVIFTVSANDPAVTWTTWKLTAYAPPTAVAASSARIHCTYLSRQTLHLNMRPWSHSLLVLR